MIKCLAGIMAPRVPFVDVFCVIFMALFGVAKLLVFSYSRPTASGCIKSWLSSPIRGRDCGREGDPFGGPVTMQPGVGNVIRRWWSLQEVRCHAVRG